jgi:hypothetical protein
MTTGRINQVATFLIQLSACARKALALMPACDTRYFKQVSHTACGIKLCFCYPYSKGIEKQSVAILIIQFFLNDTDGNQSTMVIQHQIDHICNVHKKSARS